MEYIPFPDFGHCEMMKEGDEFITSSPFGNECPQGFCAMTWQAVCLQATTLAGGGKVFGHDLVHIACSQSIAIFLLLENDEKDGEPMTQRDLERLMSMSNPSVAGVVKRLEAKGFIRRVKQGQDMRFNYLVPTEQSAALKEHLYPFLVNSEAQLLKGFSESESLLFTQFVERAVKYTEEQL